MSDNRRRDKGKERGGGGREMERVNKKKRTGRKAANSYEDKIRLASVCLCIGI